MGGRELVELRQEWFAAVAVRYGDTVSVTMTGVADQRSEAPLETFMQGLTRALARDRPARVDVDMRCLEFMAAGCFRALVLWIAGVRDGAAPSPGPVRFLANPALPWQRTSLEALRCLATDVVDVKLEPI